MWHTETTIIQEDSIIKYVISDENETLTRRAFIEQLVKNKHFRKYYNSILQECGFDSFYWENPPITTGQLDDNYEFVLIKSNALKKISPEPEAFRYYYNNTDAVVTFPNLGKDALLIVPCPISQPEHYSHIGLFVRKAPAAQIDELWRKVGESYKASIGQEKKWMSTAGLGVYWLHLRIDSRPKYYKYDPYRA